MEQALLASLCGLAVAASHAHVFKKPKQLIVHTSRGIPNAEKQPLPPNPCSKCKGTGRITCGNCNGVGTCRGSFTAHGSITCKKTTQVVSTTPTKPFSQRASSQSGAPTADHLDAGIVSGAWALASTVTPLVFVSTSCMQTRYTCAPTLLNNQRPITRRCSSIQTMATNTVPPEMDKERLILEELAALPMISAARLFVASHKPDSALLEVWHHTNLLKASTTLSQHTTYDNNNTGHCVPARSYQQRHAHQHVPQPIARGCAPLQRTQHVGCQHQRRRPCPAAA